MTKADELYQRAQRVMPGGVTASARLHKALGKPFFISSGEGGRVYDLEGRAYIDMGTSHGAALVGHGHPRVKEAVARAAEMGFICSAEHEYQTELAEKLVGTIPCAEMVRFTMSGTETTWYTVRLAREYTGRKHIVKFEGHFHGFNDYLQFNYWPQRSQAWPNVHEEAFGAPADMRDFLTVLPFNDFELLEETLTRPGHDIAAVILEPLNYNSGGICPLPGYLSLLRRLTAEQGIVLIFDEILSGFRTGPDCIQGFYGVTPDLCTLGKALAGGQPMSAFMGKAEIMRHTAPLGRAMHSGTYNANMVSVMAANACLDLYCEPGFYEPLLARCRYLYEQMDQIFARAGLCARVQGEGARFGILFGTAAEREPRCYRDVAGQDWETAYRFFRSAIDQGVYFQAAWHHGISAAHTDEDIALALGGIEAAARETATQRSTSPVNIVFQL